MADRTPIPLTPFSVELGTPEFSEICGWHFDDPYIGRLLRDDIPQRMLFGKGQTWVYRDPEKRLVGFGTIDVCDEYGPFTGGCLHPYIPLLAVNPGSRGHGHGTSIVRHLIGEAAILARLQSGVHDVLFLDVYVANERAIRLYRKCGFETITAESIPDPLENGAPYIIMAMRVSVAPSVQT